MGNKQTSQGTGGGRRAEQSGGSASGGMASRAKSLSTAVTSKLGGAGGGEQHLNAASLNQHLERASKTGVLQLKQCGLKAAPPAVFQVLFTVSFFCS